MLKNSYDVIVAGSGAAGLTAAIGTARGGLSTLVIESAEQFGGTTALSGGRIWIPANGTPENEGDSRDKAVEYLRQIFDTRYPEMIESFVDSATGMRDFVEANSPHRFVVCPNYPDYHPSFAGATIGGRCFDMRPVDLHDLVPEASNVRQPPGYSAITHAEWEKWRYPVNFDTELLAQRYADGVRTGGVALTAALVDGAVRAGAELAASVSLVSVEVVDGRISGVRLRDSEGEHLVAASTVVLATGGFDGNEDLKERLLPKGLSVSASAPSDTGIAITVADGVGATLENMGEGWWMPMVLVPDDVVDGRAFPRGLIRERGNPRQVLVNRSGERFVDEAVPYNEFGKAMHRTNAAGETPNREAFLIFDEGFRERYPLPGLSATGALPAHVVASETITGLAEIIGVDGAGLERTIARWNDLCATGHDDDFGRGDNPYDRYYGDPWQEGNPNMGPLDRGPFYAMQLYSGTIGSKGGPVTDVDARVLGHDGAIPGLYAVGNAAAFWTGDGYPGPGATLAVGMTMGFRAGRSIAATLAVA
jgi:succinate dehydrogenase/fumarate reductase flavoprotein subunit